MPSSSSPSSSPSPWLSSSIYFRLQMKIEEFRSQSNQMRNVSATQQQQQMKIRIIDFVLSFYRGKRPFTLSYPLSHPTTIDVFPFEKSRKCLIMNSSDAHNQWRDYVEIEKCQSDGVVFPSINSEDKIWICGCGSSLCARVNVRYFVCLFARINFWFRQIERINV